MSRSQLPESDVDIASKYLRDAFINVAVDDTVAADIFNSLSFQRTPRIISVRPTGAGDFGSAYVDRPFYTIARCLGRHWVRIRNRRAGCDEYYTAEIESEETKEAEKKLSNDIDPFYEAILNSIWPDAKEHRKQAWKGLRLWREPDRLDEYPCPPETDYGRS